MAINKKFATNIGLQTPNIEFSSPDGAKKIQASMLDSDTLSISGESGQLFSISDSMSGTIFAVNDISGVPSIEVDDDGTIRLAESFGNVLVGKTTNDGAKLQIEGNISVSGTVDGRDLSVDGAKLDGIAAGAQVNTVTSVASKTGAVVLTKTDVGLANVDNTTDLQKPISTATQTALDGKPSLTGTGASGTWPISISGLSGSSSSVVVKDTRAVNGTPESYTGISSDFKTNATDGLSDGGSYHGVITIRQYSSGTDWSGGGVRQLGFTDNHNLWIRGANASTTWSSWARFYKTTDASSTNTNNALVLRDASGNFSAGSITASLNGNAATASAVEWSGITGKPAVIAAGVDKAAARAAIEAVAVDEVITPFVLVSATTQPAVAGVQYGLSNAGATTLTLPPSPPIETLVWVVVLNNRSDNVLARNGSLIGGLAENMTINNPKRPFAAKFVGGSIGWVIL